MIRDVPQGPIMAIDARELIIGTWRLVHSVEFQPSGQKHYPFGEDAIGYIIYTDAGVMSVQISRRRRREAASDSSIKEDYLAYFGHYEVDLKNEMVIHFLEGQLFPGSHPDRLERKYRFYDDKLSLKPHDGTNREILWQRIGLRASRPEH
jgi:Lipocalin-like domain